MPTTAAQEEFNALIYGTGRNSPSEAHPEDVLASARESNNHSSSEPSASNKSSKAIRDSSILHSDSDSDTPRRRHPAGGAGNNKMRAKYYVPTQRFAANTGPKGVIADAQAFQQARRAHRSAAASRANLSVVPSAYADEPKPEDEYEEDDDPVHQSWLLDVDEEDSEHDEFLERWRQNRLKEMATGRVRKPRSGGDARKDARYGSLVTVDAEGYLDAIENVGRDTVVVVFIYDERVGFPFHLGI
jgi:Phosducin